MCTSSGTCETFDGANEIQSDVPTEWTCSTDYYAAEDGCDCDCGAYDPDCDIAGQEVYGCNSTEHTGACTSSGTCETVDGANETQSDYSNNDYPNNDYPYNGYP